MTVNWSANCQEYFLGKTQNLDFQKLFPLSYWNSCCFTEGLKTVAFQTVSSITSSDASLNAAIIHTITINTTVTIRITIVGKDVADIVRWIAAAVTITEVTVNINRIAA